MDKSGITYFNIEGSRDLSMFDDINNVCIMLKYMAINKDHSICFGDKTNCIMDKDLNILYPMQKCDFVDGKLVCTDKEITDSTYCVCMNNEISWNVLIKTARRLSQTDEWNEIKLIVSSSKSITEYTSGGLQ